MKKQFVFLQSLIVLTFSSITLSVEASSYKNLSHGDSYGAVNWIRDVANPDHTPNPSHFTQESRVGDTLFIDGEIQKLQWSLLHSGEYKGVKRVVLNSYGGWVDGAEDFARVIREQNLTTVIPADGVCMSACSLLFQAGVKRQAHRSAIFVYHTPRSGRIGAFYLDEMCKKNGEEFCENKVNEFISDAPWIAEAFLDTYIKYGLHSEVKNLINSLPEEPEEVWREDGNWLKKVDLVFADNSDDPRLSNLHPSYYILPLNNLEKYNVVTEWFDLDPGWRTDRSVKPENPYGLGP